MELVAIASICGWAFLIRNYNPRLGGFAPFLAMTSVILILFLSGMCGILKVGVFFVLVPGVLFFIQFLFCSLASLTAKIFKKEIFVKMAFAETAVFFVLSGVWYYWTKNSFVYGWDEFFWGQFAKAIHALSRFYDSSGIVLTSHYRYPPGIPLWQYFFTSLGPFRENAMFLANGLFTVAGYTALLTYNSKSWFSNFIKILGFTYILAAFASGFGTILVDFLIGISLGLSLVLLFRIKQFSDILWMIPAIWFFALVKQTGIVLAVFIALGTVVLGYPVASFKRKSLKVVFFAGVFVQSVVPYFLWKSYLNTMPDNGTLMNPERILNGDTFGSIMKNPDLSLAIIIKFTKALASTNLLYSDILNSSYSFVFLMVLILGIFFASKWSTQDLLPGKNRDYVCVLLVIGGAWMAVHLLSYLIIFPDKEGIQLASFSRYMSTFVIAIGVMGLYFFGEALRLQQKTRRKLWAVRGLGLFVLLIPRMQPVNVNMLMTKPEETYGASLTAKAKKLVTESILVIESSIPKNARIWLIYQDSNGEHLMITRFMASPRIFNSFGWSWGDSYGSHDLWTSKLSPDEATDLILREKPEYLFVAHADEKFWSKYKALFSEDAVFGDNSVFKVDLSGNKKYLFHYVQTK